MNYKTIGFIWPLLIGLDDRKEYTDEIRLKIFTVATVRQNFC